MSTAADAFAFKRAEVIKAGKASNDVEAGFYVAKHYPAIYETYRKASLPSAAQVAKTAPLDYSQRQALSKQSDFPLTVPPPTVGYRDFTAMVDAMLKQHPGMAEDAARVAVMAQDGGREAFERHRQEQLFGPRS